MTIPKARTERAPLMTADEAGQLAGVHVRTLHKWCNEGKVPFMRIGNAYVLIRRDVEVLITERDARKRLATRRATPRQAVPAS